MLARGGAAILGDLVRRSARAVSVVRAVRRMRSIHLRREGAACSEKDDGGELHLDRCLESGHEVCVARLYAVEMRTGRGSDRSDICFVPPRSELEH